MTTPGNLKGTTIGLRALENRTLPQTIVSITLSPTISCKMLAGVPPNAVTYTRPA